MPCSSEHMEPTARERELKNVAELLVKMIRLAGGKGPSRDLKAQANDLYGTGRWDVDHLTAELCIMCSKHEGKLKGAAFDLNPDALKIAQWWVRHQEHDAERDDDAR